jgi:tetratricopeptide (TPR) repeat protein
VAAARALFERAAAAQPTASRTWLQWGLFERAQRNAQGARRCFNMGLQANPGDAFVWQSLAALEVRGLP